MGAGALAEAIVNDFGGVGHADLRQVVDTQRATIERQKSIIARLRADRDADGADFAVRG